MKVKKQLANKARREKFWDNAGSAYQKAHKRPGSNKKS